MSVLNKPVKPYTFVDGTGNLAYGSEVNADFDIIYNKVGDVIDVVNTTDYQTLVNTAQQAIGAEALAQDWASKSDGIVDATDYSAKAYAIGGTGVSGAAGAAKEWAIKTDAAVDGSEYSAKYYAQAAAQVYDSFDDRYLGAKAADPTLDNDGNALVEGAIYWNTTLKNFKVWSGTAWQAWQYSIPDGNKGDITVSGSGTTWTVDNSTITNAKLAFDGGALSGFRNVIINGNFNINQRGYVSGATTIAGQYTIDRWKVTGTGGITFSTASNKTTVTIPSGQTLQQVIEGLNLQTGTYVLSWEGTAQGKIGAGSYGASGAVTASITGGTNTTIEFGPGTLTNVQLELGTVATPFENRPYGLELSLCQRYYQNFSNILAYANANPQPIQFVGFWIVELRSSPSVSAGGSVGPNAVSSVGYTVSLGPSQTSYLYSASAEL